MLYFQHGLYLLLESKRICSRSSFSTKIQIGSFLPSPLSTSVNGYHYPIRDRVFRGIDQSDYGIHELDVQFMDTIMVSPNPRIDGYHTTDKTAARLIELIDTGQIVFKFFF
jgi:hypothetical protein